jgi:hypothetical protein
VYEDPALRGIRSDHIGLLYPALPYKFCKSLFPRLERVSSWSQGSSFYHCTKAPLHMLGHPKHKRTAMAGRQFLHPWADAKSVLTSEIRWITGDVLTDMHAFNQRICHHRHFACNSLWSAAAGFPTSRSLAYVCTHRLKEIWHGPAH